MRSKVVLLLALLMAVVTTALFFQYLNKYNETPVTVSVTPTVEVVVAAEQIERNEKIPAEKLQLVQMDEKVVHPDALRNISEVVDKLATTTIFEGEQVLKPRIISEKEETLYVSRKIKDGYRAVSVGVNINQSVTNLIEPEDEVDVVFTKKVKKDDKELVISEIILKKVRVLAVGRKMVIPEESEEPYVEYSSVTLELKPEDSVTLVRSSEEGSIHFTLNQRPIEPTKEQSSSDS
ncbi:Flp pilus assembly protein CpaB [Pseudoneobacillus sp. C159]